MANMTTQEILQGIKDWAAPKVIYDISAAHNNTKYTDLADALGTNGGNIPQEYRKGGITVRYVQSNDNKYVQFRYIGTSTAAADFTNTANWQGVDTEPKKDSKNLIVSGAVEKVAFIADHSVQQLSVNLVDQSKLTLGYGLQPNGKVVVNADLNLSDYIPINGKNVAANGYSGTYWRAGVYDKNRTWLRAITSNYYTYQEGDYYIRINFLASNTQPRANYGNDVIAYQAYMPVEGYIENSPKVNGIYPLIEEENIYNANSPVGFVFESGTFDTSMVESEDATKARSNIFKVANKRTLYVNVPDGFQYQIYASYDNGATYGVVNLWNDPKILTVAAQEPEYALLRILIKHSSGRKLKQDEFIKFNISLDGNIVDTAIMTNMVSKEKDLGIFMSTGNAEEEQNGVSVTPTALSKCYITSYINTKAHNYPKTKRIVAMNHDDLTKIDYRGTRQIYNKYDFHSNFNFILYPFASVNSRDEMIYYVKKLINEGHSVGLHAYFNSSAWINNKLFDVRPDGSATFAPTATDLKPAAGTNINSFGQAVNATTKFRNLNYVDPPSSVANINVVDCTQSDVNTLTQGYCVFTQNENITGVDLDGNVVTKGRLEWAEYWYNNLVGNVGYSTSGTIAERFAADYAIPDGGTLADYYPDAEHLLNGKVVKFDDTDNLNYNNPDYQKVGYFTKGLFKGCCSTRNCEVIERIIRLATMVARYYFGLDHFEYFNKHGVQYANIYWQQNGYPYDDRTLQVLHHERGYWYNTYTEKFTTAYDAFKVHAIRMSGNSGIMPAKYYGQLGLYFGQHEKRSDDFDDILHDVDGLICFPQLLGASGDTMSYTAFINYFGGKDNWIKYAYENAGKTVTGTSGSTITMTTYLKNAIDVIRSLEGTNKIPFFSFDTIKENYSAQIGVDLLCRYCYINNIQIVTPEVARQMAVGFGLDYKQNFYPNPKFKQSLIEQFGEFTNKDAYMPDGIRFVSKVNNNNEYNISVEDVTISDVPQKVLTQTNVMSRVRIFGIPSGNYKFSLKGKGKGYIFILLNKNSDLANLTGDFFSRAAHYFSLNTQEWTDKNYEFTINEPYLGNINRDSAVSQLCCGGQDNVVNVEIIYYGDASDSLSIACPKICSI